MLCRGGRRSGGLTSITRRARSPATTDDGDVPETGGPAKGGSTEDMLILGTYMHSMHMYQVWGQQGCRMIRERQKAN